ASRGSGGLIPLAAFLCLSGCADGSGEAATERAAPSASVVTSAEPSLHRAALTLDTHVDIPFDFATASVDPRTAPLQVNLEKMQRGGLDSAFFIVYVGQTARTPENYAAAQRDARTKFDAIRRMT